jgi:The ARF-like 2 binding protein BART
MDLTVCSFAMRAQTLWRAWEHQKVKKYLLKTVAATRRYKAFHSSHIYRVIGRLSIAVSSPCLPLLQAAAFDRIVGALQEVLLDEAFSSKQQAFLNEHCSEFEDTEENKLSYTGIFTHYTDMIGESL